MPVRGRVYCPALRTRDSELRGYAQLASSVKDAVLPIFELTKSRRSKSNPDGSIAVTVSRLLEVIGDRPFVVDVTSLGSQSNAETAMLLDPDDAFGRWRAFVKTLPKSCIPVAHLNDPFDLDEFSTQVNDLWLHRSAVALRIPTDYEAVSDVANALTDNRTRRIGTIIVLADDGFVEQGKAAESARRCHEILNHFKNKANFVAPLTSSFPNSVMLPSFGGGDASGRFSLEEVSVSETIRAMGVEGAEVLHGDYGLICPEDFDGTVTNWVPRVDVPLTTTGYYHRYRRDAGGYVKAATKAKDDPMYAQLACWADECIHKAAAGSPPGRSPAFWIAARVNYHITRQARRLLPHLAL